MCLENVHRDSIFTKINKVKSMQNNIKLVETIRFLSCSFLS